MELTDRKKQILKVVVEDYIRSAEPVGSKAISAQMGGSVSSATVRNELADLVELGYLEQPHTSAGRIPAPKGYRLYVNELMEQHRLSQEETQRIHSGLHLKMEELDRMIAHAGQILSGFEGYPTYVAKRGKSSIRVKRFELLPVDDSSCILVLMTEDDRVKSQLLRLQLKVPADKLPQLVSLLNTHFVQRSADELNVGLMDLSEQVAPALFLLLSQVVAFTTRVLEEAERREVQTLGASQLLRLPEFRDVDKAHQLMSFLTDGKEELPMPDDQDAMKILIGPENVSEALRDTSVVVASYDIGDNMRGLIGVVGPTRMDYAAIAARLSCFADGLGRMFGKFDTNELPPKEDTEK